MVWNDSVRAAFIMFLNAVFPVGQIFGAWTFSGDETAQIMLMINLGLVFLGLIFKKGQQPGVPIIAAQGSETAPNRSTLGAIAVFVLVFSLYAAATAPRAAADWDWGGGGPGGGGDYTDWTPCYWNGC